MGRSNDRMKERYPVIPLHEAIALPGDNSLTDIHSSYLWVEAALESGSRKPL